MLFITVRYVCMCVTPSPYTYNSGGKRLNGECELLIVRWHGLLHVFVRR